jgi:hypothetical protein
MIDEAVECEMQLLKTSYQRRQPICRYASAFEFIADQRLAMLGMPKV